MKRYLYIYLKIVNSTVKSMMSYRLNFFVQLFYGPAYVFVMFLVLNSAYSQTTSLASWTRDEAVLLFSVFHLLGAIGMLIYMQSIRHFVWSGLRLGELDILLTKPINAQFMISITKPSVEQIGLLLGILILFANQLQTLDISFFSLNFMLFISIFMCGVIISYLSVSTYAVLGFFVIKAQQIIEMHDKIVDFSQYPTPIFPQTLVSLAFTVIPIAFFGYVPTLFLLGKGSLELFIAPYAAVICLTIINQLAWKKGLQSYSSASS